MNSPMADNNRKQAMMPEGCRILENDNGTAPGAAIEHNGKIFIMLPGPPFEMEPMFRDKAFPYLRGKTGGEVLESKTLRVFGMGESMVEQTLAGVIKNQTNPTIAPYAKMGEVTLRLSAKAENREAAQKMLEPVEAEIRRILGDLVYGEGEDGSIEKTVVELLAAKGLKVTTAESCTGGMIAEKITSVPGASAVFGRGVVTYANSQKEEILGVSRETLEKYGAVSSQTALEMSRGALERSDADIAVATTGVAGPDGGSADKPVGLVYVSIYTKGTHIFKEYRLAGDRNTIRTRAAMYALDMVRRAI